MRFDSASSYAVKFPVKYRREVTLNFIDSQFGQNAKKLFNKDFRTYVFAETPDSVELTKYLQKSKIPYEECTYPLEMSDWDLNRFRKKTFEPNSDIVKVAEENPPKGFWRNLLAIFYYPPAHQVRSLTDDVLDLSSIASKK